MLALVLVTVVAVAALSAWLGRGEQAAGTLPGPARAHGACRWWRA